MCSTEFGTWSWDSETVAKASGFLHQLNSFEFLISFCITMRVLSSLRSLTIKLQKKANDILAAYDLVSDVELELQLLKVKCDDEFHVWFEETKNLADELCIQVSTPRIASRQTHRSNIPANSPEAYYRRNNHITNEMEARFGTIHQTKIKLLGILPSTIEEQTFDSIKPVIELYRDDLPAPSLVSTEFTRWKLKCATMCNRPSSLQESLQKCDEDAFPNMNALLTIGCTLPVTTCENERANSQLKLLKTYAVQ